MRVQARSPVFKSMLESGMTEGETGEVSITDMNPDVFRALLHFIYSDDLPEDLQVWPSSAHSMPPVLSSALDTTSNLWETARPHSPCALLSKDLLVGWWVFPALGVRLEGAETLQSLRWNSAHQSLAYRLQCFV